MPIPVITSIISAISILAGSLVGAYCSYIISKKMYKIQLKEEHDIIKDNRKYEEGYRTRELCKNANILRLDIATALFQSIRSLQNKDEEKKYLYLMPISKNYSEAVANLSERYSLEELSYIYQLYGIIEKVNRDIYNWSVGDEEAYYKVKAGFKGVLYKIYGDNYKKVLKINPEDICYQELYKNDYINKIYKNLFLKLDNLCSVESISKENIYESNY
ncbi:MAG: hypothetical protein E7214_03455 [Clostridium sp.]|nr:hypothetical protein [Clostridium sp.]